MDPLSFVKGVGERIVNGGAQLAEDAHKLATDGHSREQAWNAAVDQAKAVANSAADAVRSVDAAKEQVGSWIDSGEKFLEKKVDDGRAWLRENGGAVGQMASDQIGFGEGIAVSVYDAGKGLVQLADGAGSLINPIEWAANPRANIARVESAAKTVGTLGKLANLTTPAGWMTDPQGNARLAGALWNSAAKSFEQDPAKFAGNVVGTIGTLLIPGAEGAGAVADVAKVSELATDAGKAVAVTEDVGKAAAIAQDAGKAVAVTEDAGKAAAIAQDAGKATAISEEAGKVAVATDAGEAAIADTLAEKPVPTTLRGAEMSPGQTLQLDLDAYRARLGIGGDHNTIAVGRTNIPALEEVAFEGASPSVRKEAGLPDLNDVAPNRPIRSPQSTPLFNRHAEEDLANNFVAKVEAAGLKPADLAGKTLNIHISNPTGVCTPCMQGFKNNGVAPGVIKQLSERYPGLTIRITADGGNAYGGRAVVEIRNGRIIN